MNSATRSDVEAYLRRFFPGDQKYAHILPEILDVLGWKGDIRSLRDALPPDAGRLGFTDFLNAMSFLGYAPKIVRTRQDKLNDDLLPCLFVPFDAKSKNEARGEILFKRPGGKIPGMAYVFKENRGSGDILPDKTLAGSGMKWFSKLLLRFRGVFRQVLVASFVINVLALATPIFMMNVYDKVIGAHSGETLKYLLIGVILAVGTEYSLRFLRARSLSWFGARIDNIVGNALLERILTLPASFTERASVGAQLSRLKAFESVREFFTGSLFLSFVEFPFTLILLTAIALIAGPLAVIPLIVAALYVLLLVALRPRLKAWTARMAAANAERQNLNIETLGKQPTLRTAGGFGAWLDRYEKIGAEAAFATYGYNRAIATVDTVSQGLLILGGIAMIYFGVERIWDNKMSMGGMVAVLILTWRALGPLQMACTALPRLSQVLRNIDQINRLMDMPPERAAYSIAQETPRFAGEVEFHGVGLRYAKDADPVYAGLAFRAEPGQLVAIAGSNSTGKSTTLRLVSGLYQPQAGSVRIDGVDIRQIDRLKLRQNIAYVAQQPEFFTGTVADNLLLVSPAATGEDMKKALAKAGLSEWLDALPDGLDTMIGAGSSALPSSLRPMLALARAYLQDSAIMLIDEMPFEFLNSDYGREFYDYLKEQKGKRTILYVTYRQDYIALADLVVQLHQDGRPQVRRQAPAKEMSHG